MTTCKRDCFVEKNIPEDEGVCRACCKAEDGHSYQGDGSGAAHGLPIDPLLISVAREAVRSDVHTWIYAILDDDRV